MSEYLVFLSTTADVNVDTSYTSESVGCHSCYAGGEPLCNSSMSTSFEPCSEACIMSP